MHFLEHILITLIVGGASLVILDAFTWAGLAIMIATTVAIDLDHVLQYLFSGRPKTFRSWMEYHMQNFREKEQKHYAFHTLEFHIILFYLSFKGWVFFLIFFSALIHILADQLNYYMYHKSLKDAKLWTTSWHVMDRFKEKTAKLVVKYENIYRKRKQARRTKLFRNRA